jgi:hypothetical protein
MPPTPSPLAIASAHRHAHLLRSDHAREALNRRTGGRGGMRRGGGGAPAWSPLSDPDTVLWLDATLSPRTESGGVIDQWNDLTTNAYHATSALTLRPIYEATGIGGAYPSITWDGINDKMVTPALAALAGAVGVTIFVAGTVPASTAKYLYEYGASGGQAGGPSGSVACITNITNADSITFYERNNVGSNLWRSNASTEAWDLAKIVTFSCNFSAAAASECAPIRSNGAALAGAQTGANEGTGTMSSQIMAIGAQVSGANANLQKLSAFIVVKRAMSDADKLVFERYLGNRLGLPFSDVMAARRVPRIVWAGQSNALTQSDAYNLLDAYDGPHVDPRVWSYKDTTIGVTTAVSGWGGLRETQPSPGVAWEGAELVTCCDLFRDYSLAPELIMVAKGATNLYLDWDPDTVGDMFDRLDTDLSTAISTHPAPPASPIPWLVWAQGESDAPSAEYVNYQANLTAFLAAFRALTGMASAKICIWLLHSDCAIPGSTPATVAFIRAAQASVAAADGACWTIDPSDLPLQGDFIHYTQATYITMGHRTSALIAAHT